MNFLPLECILSEHPAGLEWCVLNWTGLNICALVFVHWIKLSICMNKNILLSGLVLNWILKWIIWDSDLFPSTETGASICSYGVIMYTVCTMCIQCIFNVRVDTDFYAIYALCLVTEYLVFLLTSTIKLWCFLRLWYVFVQHTDVYAMCWFMCNILTYVQYTNVTSVQVEYALGASSDCEIRRRPITRLNPSTTLCSF